MDGEVFGVLVFGAAAVIWLMLPFLDGTHRTRRWVTGLSVFALAYITTMTVYGHVAH